MKGIHKEVVESSPGKPLTLCVVGFKMGDMSKNRQYSTCNKLSHLYGFNCPIHCIHAASHSGAEPVLESAVHLALARAQTSPFRGNRGFQFRVMSAVMRQAWIS